MTQEEAVVPDDSLLQYGGGSSFQGVQEKGGTVIMHGKCLGYT